MLFVLLFVISFAFSSHLEWLESIEDEITVNLCRELAPELTVRGTEKNRFKTSQEVSSSCINLLGPLVGKKTKENIDEDSYLRKELLYKNTLDRDFKECWLKCFIREHIEFSKSKKLAFEQKCEEDTNEIEEMSKILQLIQKYTPGLIDLPRLVRGERVQKKRRFQVTAANPLEASIISFSARSKNCSQISESVIDKTIKDELVRTGFYIYMSMPKDKEGNYIAPENYYNYFKSRPGLSLTTFAHPFMASLRSVNEGTQVLFDSQGGYFSTSLRKGSQEDVHGFDAEIILREILPQNWGILSGYSSIQNFDRNMKEVFLRRQLEIDFDRKDFFAIPTSIKLQGGGHKVIFIIDKKNKRVEFYESNGVGDLREIQDHPNMKLTKKVIFDFLEERGLKYTYDDNVIKVAHQGEFPARNLTIKTDGNCGIYACHFVEQRSKGRSPEEVANDLSYDIRSVRDRYIDIAQQHTQRRKDIDKNWEKGINAFLKANDQSSMAELNADEYIYALRNLSRFSLGSTIKDALSDDQNVFHTPGVFPPTEEFFKHNDRNKIIKDLWLNNQELFSDHKYRNVLVSTINTLTNIYKEISDLAELLPEKERNWAKLIAKDWLENFPNHKFKSSSVPSALIMELIVSQELLEAPVRERLLNLLRMEEGLYNFHRFEIEENIRIGNNSRVTDMGSPDTPTPHRSSRKIVPVTAPSFARTKTSQRVKAVLARKSGMGQAKRKNHRGCKEEAVQTFKEELENLKTQTLQAGLVKVVKSKKR